MKLTATGAAATDDSSRVHDRQGSGLIPVQGSGDGTAFRVLGRVAEDAPWVEIRAADTADFLESISWVPYLRIENTTGAGTTNLWIGDN